MPKQPQLLSVVFDVGNVLLDWQPASLVAKLITDTAEQKYFSDHIATLAWQTEQDCGRTWAEAVQVLSAQYPHYAKPIAHYAARWHETILGPVAGMEDIVDALLAQDVPLYAITNFSSETWPAAVARFPVLTKFRDVVVSGVEKMVKPHAPIFELLLSRNGLRAAQTVFVDDSIPNIAGARAVGMIGVHFTSADALMTSLHHLGFAV